MPTYSSADNGKVIKNGALSSQNTGKSITSNGTGIDTTYYSSVNVNVPNTYTSTDEGKVVSNGALVEQTAHADITTNGTYDITTNNSVTVDVTSSDSPVSMYWSESQYITVESVNMYIVNKSKYTCVFGSVEFRTYDYASSVTRHIRFGYPSSFTPYYTTRKVCAASNASGEALPSSNASISKTNHYVDWSISGLFPLTNYVAHISMTFSTEY